MIGRWRQSIHTVRSTRSGSDVPAWNTDSVFKNWQPRSKTCAGCAVTAIFRRANPCVR
ncbi:Uncharacterised protein [Mycobacteroides abscessus]|nr:Uncharacterised protein [Mycobacteroides abscessus]